MSDASVKKHPSYSDQSVIPVQIDAAYDKLNQCLTNDGELYLSCSEPGQKFSHKNLPSFLRGRCRDLIQIRSATFCAERWLKAGGNYDEEDHRLDREAADLDSVLVQNLWCVEQECEF